MTLLEEIIDIMGRSADHIVGNGRDFYWIGLTSEEHAAINALKHDGQIMLTESVAIYISR